ncbi:hypothetical protein L6452_40188 [Arctium lappa]|uniref:Uncharacterized protein n=1 Tax=Arctium lappa TaxID=4217 RepID=A0ACB8XKM0_ARCLA|nr:hypothetical protein L6452_40188 [Arctium lappa]
MEERNRVGSVLYLKPTTTAAVAAVVPTGTAFVKLEKVGPSDVVVDNDDEMTVLVFDESLSVGDGVLAIDMLEFLTNI